MGRVVPVAALVVGTLAGACGNSPAAGSLTGSGHVVERRVAAAPFDRLAVSGTFIATVTLGAPATVTIRADDNVMPHVMASVTGGTLHLALRPGIEVHDATLAAMLTVPSLPSMSVAGASVLRLAGPLLTEQLRFDAVIADDSRLEGQVSAAAGDLTVSGASTASFTGRVERLTARASGASHLDLLHLLVTDLDVDLSGASQAGVAVSNGIAARLSGASMLNYVGDPAFTVRDVSGASSINKL